MTQAHIADSLPIKISPDILKNLEGVVDKNFKGAQKGEFFAQIEKLIHAAFMEAERAVLREVLAQYDIDSPVVEFENKIYRQSVRSEHDYITVAGKVRIKRSLFRVARGTPSICPMELRAGIVEKFWSPSASKQALLMVSQMNPYDAAKVFKELGAMTPSKSSLDRLPKKLSYQWEIKQDEFEKSVSENFKIPKEAVAIGVSLDGVLVPMKGAVVLPNDSRYEEASCGTYTYYDKEGEPLSTRRYGCMPEHKKVSMKNFLSKEVVEIIKSRPDLQLVKVADGAKDNWTFLEGELLPEGILVLDFYHAAEHLKSAFDVLHGVSSNESYIQFKKYRSILRHDKKGINKVIRHLSDAVKKYPKKEKLQTELNYFKNNKHRCDYRVLADKSLPIGSGIVEATCKTLVTQRLKQSGMSWKPEGGQAILTFRGLLQSELFDEAWEVLSEEYCEEVKLPKNVIPFPNK